MLRRALVGLLAMGVTAAIAGYVWVAFEFPFAILLPAVVGILAVAWPLYSTGRVWTAGLVGGASFTAAFLVAIFLALTDGSPLALPAWAGALAAAAIAGAITGAILSGSRGALPLAGFSAVGMLVGVAISALMGLVAPSAVDVAGMAQSGYFAAVIGLVGAAVGASIGAGVEWVHTHENVHHDQIAAPGSKAGLTS